MIKTDKKKDVTEFFESIWKTDIHQKFGMFYDQLDLH